MEEILSLKELLLKGDISGALAIADELEEMSRDDKISNIRSYGVILLLHLIKQQAENRTTRSWDLSIRNAIRGIQTKNKRRKAGGNYLTIAELQLALEEAFSEAIDRSTTEVAEGIYSVEQLESMVDQNTIIDRALALISTAEDDK
jgi:hypothetical protein